METKVYQPTASSENVFIDIDAEREDVKEFKPSKTIIINTEGDYDRLEQLVAQISSPVLRVLGNNLEEGNTYEAYDLKLFFTYIGAIDSHKPENRTVKISYDDIARVFGVSQIKTNVMSKSAERLLSYRVNLTPKSERKDGDFDYISLFERVKSYTENGKRMLELKCTESAAPYIFKIDNIGFFKQLATNICQLASKHTFSLLLYLAKRNDNGRYYEWTDSYNGLREFFGCTNQTYDLYKYFNNKVLKKAQEELEEKLGIKFEYSPVKKSRINEEGKLKKDVVEIRFKILDDNNKFIKSISSTSSVKNNLMNSIRNNWCEILDKYRDEYDNLKIFDSDFREKVQEYTEQLREIYESKRLLYISEASFHEFDEKEIKELNEAISSNQKLNNLDDEEIIENIKDRYIEFCDQAVNNCKKCKNIRNRFKYFKKMIEG